MKIRKGATPADISPHIEDRRGLDTGPGFSTESNPFGDATFNRRSPFGGGFTGRRVLRYRDPEAEYNQEKERMLRNYLNIKRRGNPTTPKPRPKPSRGKNPFQIL